MKRRFLHVALTAMCLLVIQDTAQARLDYNVPASVLLYDGSKSMYPGYKANGERQHERLAFFHKRPDFASWLLKFLATQSDRFGSDKITLSAFYNVGSKPDVRNVPMRTFKDSGEINRLSDAVDSPSVFAPLVKAQEREDVGMFTYLKESLEQAANGFEGVIWLVTDNVVEGLSKPDEADLDDLFKMIMGDKRYRAAHVYSFPYEYEGKKGVLAFYGFLVSGEEADKAILEHLDRIFNDLTQGFPKQRHLKLKDLSTRAMASELEYSARIADAATATAQNGQGLHISYRATVRSLLTQHSVESGSCTVVSEKFQPSEDAVAAYGVEPLPDEWLPTDMQALPGIIEPGGTQVVEGKLDKKGEIRLPGMDASAMRRWVETGKPIIYKGTFRVTFSDLAIRFEPQQLEEVYGMSRALAVFGINAQLRTLTPQVVVEEKTIAISPPPAPGVNWVLPLVLLLILAALAVALLLLARPSRYRVSVSGTSNLVSLRPLCVFRVRHGETALGSLRRLMNKDFQFMPTQGVFGFTIERQLNPGAWRAVVNRPNENPLEIPILIESLDGGKDKSGSGQTPAKGSQGMGGPTAAPGPAREKTGATARLKKRVPPP